MHDAVLSGTLDGGHGVTAYWYGKHKAYSLFGTPPARGWRANQMIGWMKQGGGQALYDELVQQVLGLNLVGILTGPMPMAVGLAYLAFDGNWEPVMSLLVQRPWWVMTNDILIPAPPFVFMGYIIDRADILDRLFRSNQLAAGGLPGSLAVGGCTTKLVQMEASAKNRIFRCALTHGLYS